MTASIIPAELYKSVSPYYEGYYGKLSNDIYELTEEKAQHYLDNYDIFYKDLQHRQTLFDCIEMEEVKGSAMALAEFIEEWLVKTECLEEFSQHCNIPVEMYEMVKTNICNY